MPDSPRHAAAHHVAPTSPATREAARVKLLRALLLERFGWPVEPRTAPGRPDRGPRCPA